jgi:hypothetical protein
MKLKIFMIFMVLMFLSGGMNLMAEEFSIYGIKNGARIGNIQIELTGVSLEESDQGAAINLSFQLTDEKGSQEKLYLSVPASHREGSVKGKLGSIILKSVEGLDSNFYNSPEKIFWHFEFQGATNVKIHIYRINGKIVTEKEYNSFLQTLTGKENLHYIENRGGGETFWESKDSSGKRYRISEKSGINGTSSISRIP